MQDDFYNWDFESPNPDKNGIYAILICWDPREGIFDGSARWDGKAWNDNTVVCDPPIIAFSVEPFESEELAETWADMNNPDNE